MLITCLECGKEFSSESQACTNCGSPTPHKCPRCFEYAYVGRIETIHTEAITKTQIRQNLNPFRIFTIARIETKTIRPESYKEVFVGRCLHCNYPGKSTLSKEENRKLDFNGMSENMAHLLMFVFAILAVVGMFAAYNLVSYLFR